MKSVYLVVLNWNRKEDTLECLKSVSQLLLNNFKLYVVIVDNASTDGSLEYFKNRASKNSMKIIVNDSNLGFAAGNNVGINFALVHGADYVLLLNNDTRLDKQMLSELVAAAERHPDGGAFSPKIYFEKGFEFHKNRYKKNDLGRVIWAAGGDIDWANVFGKNIGVDEVDTGQFSKIKKVEFATGACVLYRASALRKTGVFDERYFLYYEDVDLSLRLKLSGYKVYFVPGAVLWHKVSQSSNIGGELNDYFISRNRLLFGFKYASLRTKFALLREAFKLRSSGRPWQKKGVGDFFLANFRKGSWK